MNFLKRITILLSVTALLFVSAYLILFAFQYIDYSSITSLTQMAYFDDNFRMIVGIIGGVLLVVNYLLFQLFSVNIHRDKIVAFDNPSGRVTLSLFAMEDLLRRLIARLEEVKDVKIQIFASRKGLRVQVRIIISSETRIPELTSKVQSLVLKKIQESIGMDEKVDISVYVNKILPEKVRIVKKEKKKAAAEDSKESSEEPRVPFHGYRA